MVPIHDTDLAQDRWSKGEWDNYELWEKIEHRLKKRRRRWIAAAWMVFLLLCTIPVVMDRAPKWRALATARRLAQEINQIKRDTSIEHMAYRIRFSGEGELSYVIEKGSGCTSNDFKVVRLGSVVSLGDHDLTLVGPRQAQDLRIPGLVEEFCYDSLSGNSAVLRNEAVTGFAILPVKDLAEHRMDRLIVLLLTGPSAEISFDS